MDDREKQHLRRNQMMDSQLIEKVIAAIEKELPEVFPRHKINKLSPSFPWAKGTMQNRDCDGNGVKEKFTIGKHVFYTRASTLALVREELSK